MRTFKKGNQTLVASNEVQARAFISAGYVEEVAKKETKKDAPKK